MNQTNSAKSKRGNLNGGLRALWFVLAIIVVMMVATAVPLRLQMLLADTYGYGPALAELGLTLRFFAAYFTFWELVVIGGSLIVAAMIVWRSANDRFAMFVAITLTLYGLLPPLVDGLTLLNPLWQWPISFLRFVQLACLMAVFCLFPNGRFQPRWSRWLFASWLLLSTIFFILRPDVLADTAVLPNTRTFQDAFFLLLTGSWFAAAVAGQIFRFFRVSTAEEQQQTKWVLFGFVIIVFVSLLSALLLVNVPQLREDPVWGAVFVLTMGVLYLLAALMLPVTIALAMLRFRLWEVDFIINRTLVYGGLTALVTAVYILLVGGVGTMTAGQSGLGGGLLLATLLVALIIKPLRQAIQRAADRLFPVSYARSQPLGNATAVGDQNAAILQGRTLLLARSIWAANLLLALILFVVGTATMVQRNLFQAIIDQSYPVDVALLQIVQESLMRLGAGFWVINYLQMVAFVIIGLILFWRKSKDRMGILASLMLIALGFGFTVNVVFLPLIAPIWHIPTTIFQAIMFGATLLFLFWFPDGLSYPQWTRLLFFFWFLYAAIWLPFPQLNPHRSASIWPVAIWMGWVWLGVVAQLIRYRRLSTPPARQQTKWVIAGFMAANIGLLLLLLFALLNRGDTASGFQSLIILPALGSVLVPLTIAFALFRYRLWEIDFIINRSLVYGGVTTGILFIYVLIVGGLSTLFQAQNSLFISLLATGLIAVVFQPLRTRLQRGINRLMFGERDDPYSVLSQLGRQLRETAVPGQTLPAITATICQTLKLPYAAIELIAADHARQLAAVTGKKQNNNREWPLMYQGEIIGWLTVAPRAPEESFTIKESQLLEDIAAQAGAVAYSVRLTSALQHSREKLVLAREEERRRIRRDLHDGLGPSLASQTFKLDAALDLLETDPQAVAALLQSLKLENQALVSDIRRLVYELRPPALDELGLIGALEAHLGQIHGSNVPRFTLTTQPHPLPPLPAAVEVAAYRIALEAITNVVRHAQAQTCTVYLETAVEHFGNRQQISRNRVTDDFADSSRKPQFANAIDFGKPSAVYLGNRQQISRNRVTDDFTDSSRKPHFTNAIDFGKPAAGYLTLSISDDGVGLIAVKNDGVGLTSMRERTEELGGVLLLSPLVEGGTRVTAVLPVDFDDALC